MRTLINEFNKGENNQMARAKKTETQPEVKDLDLSPRQYLLFNNDKGDNPKRPDLRGQVCLSNGVIANISAWKRWTITNEMKLEGSIQTRQGQTSTNIGKIKLFTTNAKKENSPLMVGEAEFTDGKPMAVTLYSQTSKNGLQYFSGFFNEIAQTRIDPLASPTTEPEQDEIAL